MNNIFNTGLVNWLKTASIRAVKAFFQVFASLITVDGLTTGLSGVDWLHITSVAAVSFIYSLATSFAGLPELERSDSTDKSPEKSN